LQVASGDSTRTRRPPTRCLNLSQLAADGQSRSVGRTRRKGLGAAGASLARRGERKEKAGIEVMCRRKLRRFME
jgi:hypothetical protein